MRPLVKRMMQKGRPVIVQADQNVQSGLLVVIDEAKLAGAVAPYRDIKKSGLISGAKKEHSF